MQDVQNIPPPDVKPTERDDDFDNHSDIKKDLNIEDEETVPVPPDRQPVVPIKDPPDVNKPPIGEGNEEPEYIA